MLNVEINLCSVLLKIVKTPIKDPKNDTIAIQATVVEGIVCYSH